jgi:two-component system response regulator NreC
MIDDLIRIIVVDDHSVVRTGIKSILCRERDFLVVGEASDGAECVALAEELQPDVAVVDLTMFPVDGVEATRRMAEKRLRTRVIILTMHEEEAYLLPAITAGAAGYVLKSDADANLADAVRAVAHGHRYLRTHAIASTARRQPPKSAREEAAERFGTLSPRERAIFVLVAQGFAGPEIGAHLEIGVKTVETYRQRIKAKLGFQARHQFVRFALGLGLLTEDGAPGSVSRTMDGAQG